MKQALYLVGLATVIGIAIGKVPLKWGLIVGGVAVIFASTLPDTSQA